MSKNKLLQNKRDEPLKKKKLKPLTAALNKIKLTKKNLLEALVKSHGIITSACASVGVSRMAFYRYYNEDKVFKIDVNSIEETAIDFVEGKLFNNIEAEDVASILFYLKCKARHRGYLEKQIIGISKEKENYLTDEEMSSVVDNLDTSDGNNK